MFILFYIYDPKASSEISTDDPNERSLKSKTTVSFLVVSCLRRPVSARKRRERPLSANDKAHGVAANVSAGRSRSCGLSLVSLNLAPQCPRLSSTGTSGRGGASRDGRIWRVSGRISRESPFLFSRSGCGRSNVDTDISRRDPPWLG